MRSLQVHGAWRLAPGAYDENAHSRARASALTVYRSLAISLTIINYRELLERQMRRAKASRSIENSGGPFEFVHGCPTSECEQNCRSFFSQPDSHSLFCSPVRSSHSPSFVSKVYSFLNLFRGNEAGELVGGTQAGSITRRNTLNTCTFYKTLIHIQTLTHVRKICAYTLLRLGGKDYANVYTIVYR